MAVKRNVPDYYTIVLATIYPGETEPEPDNCEYDASFKTEKEAIEYLKTMEPDNYYILPQRFGKLMLQPSDVSDKYKVDMAIWKNRRKKEMKKIYIIQEHDYDYGWMNTPLCFDTKKAAEQYICGQYKFEYEHEYSKLKDGIDYYTPEEAIKIFYETGILKLADFGDSAGDFLYRIDECDVFSEKDINDLVGEYSFDEDDEDEE